MTEQDTSERVIDKRTEAQQQTEKRCTEKNLQQYVAATTNKRR